MNKNAIKKFAIDARNKLIASVTDKAGMLGITPDNCSETITKGADFEVYKTVAGTEVTLNKKQCEQRGKLVDQIHARGFEAVVEEVAYTWFNRICAIRFMEVNDYMYPVRVRVLSSEKEGKNEPDVVTMAPDIDWNLTDKEREEIIDAKMNNRLDDLFRMLFIKQCNLLHEVLPGLFEETEDYTEMLLNISFTNEDDVIRMLVDGIDEKDFNIATVDEDGKTAGQVEIIGWLYQYYNTEPKNKAFAKKAKITKEEVPAVTQLFTPDWIVRYMVENSLGRMWVEGHPDDELKYCKALDDNGLTDKFWELCEKFFGYKAEKPNIDDLSACMILTYASSTLKATVPEAMRTYILKKRNDVVVFIRNIMDNVNYQDAYDKLVERIDKSLRFVTRVQDGLKKDVEKKKDSSLQLSDIFACDAFARLDDIIIDWALAQLNDEILDAQIDGLNLAQVADQRMSKAYHYSERNKNEYTTIKYAYLMMKSVSLMEFSSDIKTLVTNYQQESYLIDSYYRWFYYALYPVDAIIEKINSYRSKENSDGSN